MVQYKCNSDTICAMYFMFITRTGKGKELILTLRNLLNPRIRKAWPFWGFIPQQPNSSGCEPAHIPVLPFRLSLVLSSKSTRRTAYQNCFETYFCKFPLTFKKKKRKESLGCITAGSWLSDSVLGFSKHKEGIINKILHHPNLYDLYGEGGAPG